MGTAQSATAVSEQTQHAGGVRGDHAGRPVRHHTSLVLLRSASLAQAVFGFAATGRPSRPGVLGYAAAVVQRARTEALGLISAAQQLRPLAGDVSAD